MFSNIDCLLILLVFVDVLLMLSKQKSVEPTLRLTSCLYFPSILQMSMLNHFTIINLLSFQGCGNQVFDYSKVINLFEDEVPVETGRESQNVRISIWLPYFLIPLSLFISRLSSRL